MPRWVLICPSCKQEFTHLPIEKRPLEDSQFDRKPAFPSTGLAIDCPNCHGRSVFQKSELTFRDD